MGVASPRRRQEGNRRTGKNRGFLLEECGGVPPKQWPLIPGPGVDTAALMVARYFSPNFSA